MKNSEKLLFEIAEVRSKAPAIDMMKRDVLIANLIFVYQVIRASEDLLDEAFTYALGSCQYTDYLNKHLNEEKDHAKWLLNDLCDEVEGSISFINPDGLAAKLVGAQYYLIKYATPYALLGYMAVLECFPAPIAYIELLEQKHGVELLRTMRYHAVHDVEHSKDLLDIVDTLDEQIFSVVLANAIDSQMLLNEFVGSIKGL